MAKTSLLLLRIEATRSSLTLRTPLMESRPHRKRGSTSRSPVSQNVPARGRKSGKLDRLSRSAARESLHWYRLIVDNVRDFAIFSADVKGEISSWNPGAERFFGYRADEILGKPMDVLYCPEDRAAGIAEQERKTALEQGTSEDERWHIRKDGSRFFVFGRVNPMYTDEGEICGFIKIARDITNRKELQTRLDSNEQLHRMILQNIPEIAVFSIDPNRKIQTWNKGAEQTYGYESKEVIGKNIALLYLPEERARGEPERILATTLKDGFAAEEHWCLRKDGTRIFVTGVLRPICDESGNLRGFSIVGRDITTRRKLQEDLERARAELEQIVAQRTESLTEVVHELETFSYSLSHDMRAPLRAMQGFAQELATRYSASLPEPAKNLLHRIASAAERLDRLIKESLTFHRSSREPLPLEPTPLEPLFDALCIEHPQLREPGVLSIQQPLLSVLAHPPSLAQALGNLLKNALRFVSPGRKPEIRIWTDRRDGYVRICVEDNGIGIPAANHEKVWNLFSRLHPERYEGLGVGLALVRRAVERMGGTTGVESEDGQGSLFWIELKTAR